MGKLICLIFGHNKFKKKIITRPVVVYAVRCTRCPLNQYRIKNTADWSLHKQELKAIREVTNE